MPKLAILSGKEVMRILEKKLGYILNNSDGRHRIFINFNTNNSITVPDHKEIATGTMRTIIRQTGLSIEEFMKLRD